MRIVNNPIHAALYNRLPRAKFLLHDLPSQQQSAYLKAPGIELARWRKDRVIGPSVHRSIGKSVHGITTELFSETQMQRGGRAIDTIFETAAKRIWTNSFLAGSQGPSFAI
jgi:hypothetical protein